MIVVRNGKEVYKGKSIEKIIKYYSSVSNKSSLITRESVLKRVPLEMMKCLEMYEKPTLGHWITKAGALLEESIKFYPPQVVFMLSAVKDFQELRGVIGLNEIKILTSEYKSPDDFIDDVRDKMLTEKGLGGRPKYENHFKRYGIRVNNDSFKYFMKFTALCLSGQLSIETCDDFWAADIQKLVDTTKVDLTTFYIRKKDLIYKVVSSALYGYTYKTSLKRY